MSNLGNKLIFSKNLNRYMVLNNKTRKQLANDLNLPYTTITSWCKGEFYPRIDKIEMLANYFEIKKSDLVEEPKTTNPHELFIRHIQDELRFYNPPTSEQEYQIIEYIRYILRYNKK